MDGFDSAIMLAAATEAERPFASKDWLHAQKMAALGELASGITHDFRNVLQTVIGTLDNIDSRANDPAEVRRLTASALRAAERGISLTRRLLTFVHYKAVEARPICLLASLESATETLTRTIAARMNIRIEPPASDLWPVVIDPSEFELALINLGINARDAMSGGGRIRVGARNVTIPLIERRTLLWLDHHQPADRRGPRLALPGGDYVAVTVRDTGTGMDEATLARAIEPFFTTKPLGRGTGLGLATVHDLVTQAGGALRLISQLGQGTTAELWFPRAPAVIAQDQSTACRVSSSDAVEASPVLSGNPGQVCNPNDE